MLDDEEIALWGMANNDGASELLGRNRAPDKGAQQKLLIFAFSKTWSFGSDFQSHRQKFLRKSTTLLPRLEIPCFLRPSAPAGNKTRTKTALKTPALRSNMTKLLQRWSIPWQQWHSSSRRASLGLPTVDPEGEKPKGMEGGRGVLYTEWGECLRSCCSLLKFTEMTAVSALVVVSPADEDI